MSGLEKPDPHFDGPVLSRIPMWIPLDSNDPLPDPSFILPMKGMLFQDADGFLVINRQADPDSAVILLNLSNSPVRIGRDDHPFHELVIFGLSKLVERG